MEKIMKYKIDLLTYLDLKALSLLFLKTKPSRAAMAFSRSSSLAKLMNMYLAPGPHCFTLCGFKFKRWSNFFA